MRWNPEERQVPQGMPPLTAKQLADMERDSVYIFNVSPRGHGPVQANGRNYFIPACEEGEQVSKALKIPGIVYGEEFKRTVNICTNEFTRTQEDGADVAKKILGIAPFCAPDQDLTRWGCFVSKSAVPSGQEINEALAQWLQRCDELVKEADGHYSVNNGMVSLPNGRLLSNIASQHRIAAKALNVTRPWVSPITKLDNCPSCGVSVPQGVAFCSNGCIVDEAKARKARPWLFAEAARGPGRPPKEVA